MSGESLQMTKGLLLQHFQRRHIDAALKHYDAAVDKFVAADWEGAEQKAGKFLEAVTKALVLKAGKKIDSSRHFNAGRELRLLENIAGYPDELRLVIPRAGIFVYDVVSNRGGRHDASDIDANEMDAVAIMPLISWMLAELVRFCGGTNPEVAVALIKSLIDKKYPYFEEIDGHFYVNYAGLQPGEIALLVLYFKYPVRISRQSLVDSIVRHGVKAAAANSAVHRLKSMVDESQNGWRLRGIGRGQAEAILKSLK